MKTSAIGLRAALDISLTTLAAAACVAGTGCSTLRPERNRRRPREAAAAVAAEPGPQATVATQGPQGPRAPREPRGPAAAPAAAEPADLLQILHANGTLTREQYEDLTAAQGQAPQPAQETSSFTLDAGGLRFRSADGQSSMRIGGRLQVDASFHPNSSGLDGMIQDGTELRRARIELRGTLPENLIWAAEVDFANNGTSLKDFWMGIENASGPTVYVGHQKQPFSLAVEMSSNDIPFVERSIDNYLIIPFIDRAIGVRAEDNTDNLFWAAGIFGESVSPNASAVVDEGWGAVARVVGAPVIDEDTVVHLGVRGAYRAPEGPSGAIRIRDESTNMSNLRVVDSGMITGVDSVTLYGFEAVFVEGPFSVGGEYNRLLVHRSGNDLDLESWHAQATWTVTGASRARAYRIDAGEFKRLGADGDDTRPLEVAVRYAVIDLNDAGLAGGEEHAVTFGLNWYYNADLRFLLDYTRVLDTERGSATTRLADGLDVFTARSQITF